MMRACSNRPGTAMRHPALAIALSALLGLLVAQPGFAADAPKKSASFGSGKPTGGLLTREQLRACLAQQAGVARLDEQLPKDKAELAATQDELVRSGEALKATLDALDRTNAEAVAAYNEQAQARDARVDAHQARVSAFNARVSAAQGERDGFVKACGNRSYFEEDANAIRNGR